eukprot:c8159_g1_i1 orf=227-379(-)
MQFEFPSEIYINREYLGRLPWQVLHQTSLFAPPTTSGRRSVTIFAGLEGF